MAVHTMCTPVVYNVLHNQPITQSDDSFIAC